MSKFSKLSGQCLDFGFAVSSAWPIAKRLLPPGVRQWLRTQQQNLRKSPPVGWVRLGNLRRVTPISRVFGFDRGLPVDRYYIERFLSANESNIGGHVLEIAEDKYTTIFGRDRVTESTVLHVWEGNPKATIVADLTSADFIPSNTFECMILTQTLQFIYDLKAAILTLRRILKPGGVLLATVPGISQISRYDMERWGDHWRFTTLSAQKLFAEVFSPSEIHIRSYGNVLSANALLQGLAAEELRQEELDYHDPDYELLIAVKAIKLVDNDEYTDDRQGVRAHG
jgi:hypothetical protein